MELTQISGLDVLCSVSMMALALIVFKKLLFPTPVHLLAAADGTTSLVPKGSFGFPYIGEAIQFACSDPVAFGKPRAEKYGKVFKTRLLGTPTIMVTCPDLAKYIFADRLQEFRYTYPLYMEKLLGVGGQGFSAETGHLLHRAAKNFFSPELLRFKVADIESMVLDTFLSWAARGTIESLVNECVKLTMIVGIHLILGLEPDDPITSTLENYFQKYTDGLRCLPIKLPGTQYTRALKAKKNIENELAIFIEKRARSRKGCPDHSKSDLLDVILELCDENGHGGSKFPTEDVTRFILLFLFGAREPVGYTITWAMKLLLESAEALHAVTMENDEIRRRKGLGEPLTWADFKDMMYTLRVIQESLRISSIASGPTRQALQDVHHGGHAIPKNWNVMILLPAIHKNAEYFPDPLRFNPSRFEKAPKLNTFMPFGCGRHSCVGVEVAKLELLVVLHLLTTQFSWERVGVDTGIVNYPWPVPRDGVPINIRAKSTLPNSHPKAGLRQVPHVKEETSTAHPS